MEKDTLPAEGEDAPPAAVETIQQKPRLRKRLLVVGAVFLVVVLLMNPQTSKFLFPNLVKIPGTSGFSVNKTVPQTIEISDVRTLPFTMIAQERYVDMNFSVFNITYGGVTSILVMSNESYETWNDIAEFNMDSVVGPTEYKSVYLAQYGYRNYYFWWHNDALLALDTTDIDDKLLANILRDLPPTKDIFYSSVNISSN